MNTFSDQYCKLLQDIMEHGVEETNQRTGVKTKALPGATIQVDLEKAFPLLTSREIRIENFVAEMMWFISGNKNTGVFLRGHTKIWESFTEENGDVETAYGYRWRHHFNRDQLWGLIKLLKNDQSSRHGVVMMWDPSSDGLGGVAKKNIPCPFTFTVNIIGGRLHLHLIIRSNDMVLGCPTDAAGFGLLALILAQELGVRPGIFTYSISNAHIYANHYFAARQMISLWNTSGNPEVRFPLSALPKDSFVRAEELDEALFEELVKLFKDRYSSHPAIKGLIISL